MRPARTALLVALLAASGACPPWRACRSLHASTLAQDSGAPGQAPISVRTNLVVLPVSVTDRQGHFVTGLHKANFQIFDDGQPQLLAMFEDADLPVTAGLVVDHSGSMGSKLAEVSAAAAVFAQSSNRQDQLFVVNFNDRPSLALPRDTAFTGNEHELQAAIGGASAVGRTALYDAIAEALDHLTLNQERRQALVVITDGGDNASRHTFAQVLSLAQKSSAQIYCIGVFDHYDPDAKPSVLKKLAQVTGGRAYFPESVDQISTITRKIAQDLREQYTLAFAPSGQPSSAAASAAAGGAAQPGWHNIRVTVSAPGKGKLIVRTRAGYYFRSGSNETEPAAAPPLNQP